MVMLIITLQAPLSPASGQTITNGGSSVTAPVDTGLASFYAARLHAKKTASGERLHNGDMVAAHPTLPLGSVVRVTNLDNGRSVDVRIIDRGPAARRVAKGYIIDLSRAAARALRFRRAGKARVRVQALSSTP